MDRYIGLDAHASSCTLGGMMNRTGFAGGPRV